jgi:ethanolamine ammonia-lyase small subunit
MPKPPKIGGDGADDAAGDPWVALRQSTAARIGLARTGASLATAPLLDFRLAHARARDAVHTPLDEAKLLADLSALDLPVHAVSSAVADRALYLLRPDLGRRLAAAEAASLTPRAQAYDVVFVVTDGLSARAVQSHAQPLLAQALPDLAGAGWQVAPLILVRFGRVAVGDAVARALNADSVVVLIGERPGLSAPDSMGAYLTWQPGPHTTDAQRNCISNIRPDGIGYVDAAFTLVHLLKAMRARRISGVSLKDTTGRLLAD